MSDKKSRTRERILEAARSALIQHGPAEPSVSQVMGAAGLTVGGFYAHFDSKDELMLEAFRQLLGERRALLAQIDPSLDGAGRRALASAFYLSRKHRDAEVHACPLPNSLGEMQRLPEAFREVLAEHIELMTAPWSTGLKMPTRPWLIWRSWLAALPWPVPWVPVNFLTVFCAPPNRRCFNPGAWR